MIKATTSHGTYYLIDEENMKAIRVPASDRGQLFTDGDWFHIRSWTGAEIGKCMYFNLRNNPYCDWQQSTPVVSIEEYDG